MSKVCYNCNIEREDSLFTQDYRYDPPRPRHLCTPCSVLRNAVSREKNRTEYNLKAQQRRWLRKLRAIEYKGGVCFKCKTIVHPAAFDFHHVSKEEKHKDPGLMMSHSDESLFKELDKCILLCANCHREEHFSNGY